MAEDNKNKKAPSVEIVLSRNESNEASSTEILSSYKLAAGHYDLGVYGNRLMNLLKYHAQCYVRGLDFKGGSGLGQITVGEWGDAEIVIPVKYLLSGEDDKNHAKAKEGIRSVMGKFLEYENDKRYYATQLLDDVDLKKEAGKLYIHVSRGFWSLLLNMKDGFRVQELETSMKLRGKYTQRFYELFYRQTGPITYSIDELRAMFCLKDKYKKIDDFVKNTVVSAKEELDRVSSYSFDFVPNYAKSAEVNRGRRGRPSMTSITFFPKRKFANESESSLRKQVDPSLLLDHELYMILKNKFEFDPKGIRANITLFDVAQKECPDILEFLDSIAPSALRADNIQGYVVNAVRKHLEEKYSIVVDGTAVIRYGSPDSPQSAGRPKPGPSSLKEIIGDVK